MYRLHNNSLLKQSSILLQHKTLSHYQLSCIPQRLYTQWHTSVSHVKGWTNHPQLQKWYVSINCSNIFH